MDETNQVEMANSEAVDASHEEVAGYLDLHNTTLKELYGDEYEEDAAKYEGYRSSKEEVEELISELKASGKTAAEIKEHFKGKTDALKIGKEFQQYLKTSAANKQEAKYQSLLKEEFGNLKDTVLQKADAYIKNNLGVGVSDYLKGLSPSEKVDRLKDLQTKFFGSERVPNINPAAGDYSAPKKSVYSPEVKQYLKNALMGK
jgi:hypothetical protein